MNRVYLEEADRPPPSYYDHNGTMKKDPKEWVKAPEFVPRSRVLNQAFSLDEGGSSGYGMEGIHRGERYDHPVMDPPHSLSFPRAPFFNNLHPPQFNLPFPSMNNTMGPPINPGSLPFLPQGYSANITNINTGIGPPIPAIVLKKKRRKRHKNRTNSLILPCPEEREEKREEEEEEEEGIAEDKVEMRGTSDDTTRSIASIPECSILKGSSCPDLSQDQLIIWENLLYERVCEEKSPPPPAPRNAREAMKSSTYDIIPRSLREVAEGHIQGLSSREIRRIDAEINGNVMSDSLLVTRLQEDNIRNGNIFDNDASVVKSLATELNEITFRPQMTNYGYPQYHEEKSHFSTFNYGTGKTSSKIINMSVDDDERFVQDSLEGFNIRVNHFEEIDDGDLSESDLPAPSRFEKIHWALQNRAQQYREAPLRPPDRVCCSIQ